MKTAAVKGGIAYGADGCVVLTAAEGEAIWEAAKKQQRERAERIPDEATALRVMQDAYTRLKELGWRDAIYCPKDGTRFQAIESGSSGVHHCYYHGKWPNGSWWIEDEDTWP